MRLVLSSAFCAHLLPHRLRRTVAPAELDHALRKLDFPYQLPQDAFCKPNFPLMACCLTWLLRR